MIEKKRKRPDVVPEKKATPTAPATSLLRSDEAFPRGGGSVLTPIEYKEATNEAKRDALFEEAIEKPSKKSKRRKSMLETDGVARDGPKIEGLSFKVRVLHVDFNVF